MERDELINHLIDIKTQMAVHEESDNALRSDVRRVLELYEKQDQRVDILERENVKIRTSVKLFQWIAGIAVAVGVGLLKNFKN